MHPDWQNQTHQYCENYSSSEPEVLQKLTQFTWLRTVNPRQLSGHLQGRFLAQLVQIFQPKKILEIGTFTGYATYCLAENAPNDAEIISIEADAEIAHKCQQFWKDYPLGNRVNWKVGPATTFLSQLSNIDLIFIDADKHNYKTYFDMCLPLLNPNGVMIFDNTLWSGKVVTGSKDRDTQNMHQFNEYVNNHSGVNVTLLPIRDGLTWVSPKN